MAKIKQITDIPLDENSYKLAHVTTGIRYKNGDWSIKHYATQIIQVHEGLITLNGGGYRSETTKDRLNFYLKLKGIEITEENGIWNISFNNDSTLFYDGIIVGGPDNFDLSNCVFDTDTIHKRDKVLQYLESEIKEYQVLPDKYVYDICKFLNFPNINLAVETLDHAYILECFKKLCHTRLPDVEDILEDYDKLNFEDQT